MAELNEVLAYRNASVIEQFCHEHPEITRNQASQLFQDCLAWLWLSVNRTERQLATHMIAPLNLLDQIWHVFILHTHCYTEFCQRYFGHYLHHHVEPLGAEFVMQQDELAEYLSDCYDCLGEGWLQRNFL